MEERIIIGLLILCCATSLQAYDCSHAEQCQQSLDSEMQTWEKGGHSKASEVEMCRDVRESMDCLVWIATSCGKGEGDQLRLGANAMKGRRFLQSNCEDIDGLEEVWMESACYRNITTHCNPPFESRKSDKLTQQENCKIYEEYKLCADKMLADHCDVKERRFFNSFLLDNGKKLAYVCSDPVPHTASLIQRLPVPEAWSASDIFDKFDAFRNALKSMACLKQLEEPIKMCIDKYKEDMQKRMLEGAPSGERDMLRKQCCLFRELENCVERTVKDSCGDETHKAVRKVVKTYEDNLTGSCEEWPYGSPECSSGASVRPFVAAIMSLMAITFSVMFLMH